MAFYASRVLAEGGVRPAAQQAGDFNCFDSVVPFLGVITGCLPTCAYCVMETMLRQLTFSTAPIKAQAHSSNDVPEEA